jgi:hypothetical protein
VASLPPSSSTKPFMAFSLLAVLQKYLLHFQCRYGLISLFVQQEWLPIVSCDDFFVRQLFSVPYLELLNLLGLRAAKLVLL